MVTSWLVLLLLAQLIVVVFMVRLAQQSTRKPVWNYVTIALLGMPISQILFAARANLTTRAVTFEDLIPYFISMLLSLVVLLGAYRTEKSLNTPLPVKELPDFLTLPGSSGQNGRFDEYGVWNDQNLPTFLDSINIGIGLTNMEGRWVYVNRRTAKIFGYTPEELYTMYHEDVCHPEDNAKVMYWIDRLLRGETHVFEIEVRYIRKDGNIVWVDVSMTLLFDEQGQPQYLVGAANDITERKQVEDAFQAAEARWRSLVENAPVIITMVDRDGKILFINRSPSKTPTIEQFGRSILDPFSDTEKKKLEDALFTIFEQRQPVVTRSVIVKSESSQLWYENHIAPIIHGDKVTAAIFVSTDITERKQVEERLLHLSTYDELTGVFNRNHFESEIDRLQACPDYPMSVVVVDVNDMKTTNDTFGHDAGDDLLIRTAQILREAFRPEDVISRTGGDEFVALLVNADENCVEGLVGRVRSLVNAYNQNRPVSDIRLAIGSATGSGGVPLRRLLKMADDRMYMDKRRAKRNQ